MPQQPNELGPFSEYLTNPLKPSTPQATGFEGTGTNIAFIASKFLDGVKQHRAEQFAREQAEEEKGRRGYEMAMDAIAKNPTLTPMKRQELMAPLLNGIIGQAGSVKESGKHTGNPLTDVMKNIFTNITGGGQLPKGQKFDMALVGKQLTEMQNEQNHIPYHLSAGDQGVAKLISSMGNNATQEKLLNSEEFRNLVNQTRQNTGIADWAPDIAHLPKDEADLYKRRATIQGFRNYLPGVMAETPQQPTETPQAVAPQTPTPAPTATPPVSGTTSAAPVAPASTQGKTLQQIRTELNRHADQLNFLKSQGVPPSPGQSAPPYSIDGTEIDYIDPSAPPGRNIFRGVTVQGGNESGVYNLETGKSVTGARRALASDINTASPDDVAQAKGIANAYRVNINELFKGYPAFASSFQAMLDTAALDKKDPAGKLNQVLKDAESQAKSLWEKKIAESNAANQRSIMNAARGSTDVQQLFNTYSSAEPVKQYNMANAQVASVDSAIANAVATKNFGDADLLLIRAIAKLSDPATGVRDAEYANFAKAAGSINAGLTRIQALFEKNGNILDEKTRNLLLSDLKYLKSSLERNKTEYQDQTIRLAKELGVEDRVKHVMGVPTAPPPSGPVSPSANTRPSAPPRRRGNAASARPSGEEELP